MVKGIKKEKLTAGQSKSNGTESSSAQTNSAPRLYRSEKDKMIGGVAGGLAEYLNVDPMLVRLFFLILLFGVGSGFLIYIALWIILPSENSVQTTSKDVIHENVSDVKDQAEKIVGDIPGSNQTGRIVLGALVIFVGTLAMLNAMDIHIDLSWFWPILIVGAGIIIITKK